MPRPRCCRRIAFTPRVVYYKPRGVPLRELDEVSITSDELEALRLADFLELEQIKAAEQMGISQPTLNRILTAARKKIADALVNGKAIRIEEVK
ncbi:MAG: DUF134 domain-containing protein [Nitrososphaerales archaeon]